MLKIDLADVTIHNLKVGRTLCENIFPNDCNNSALSKAAVGSADELAKIAYCQDIPVGVVFVEQNQRHDKGDSENDIYLTLGVLEQYRNNGVG